MGADIRQHHHAGHGAGPAVAPVAASMADDWTRLVKFAYASNAFRRYPLPRVVEMVADLGFAGIELLADFPHFYPPDWPDDKLPLLLEVLGRRNLAVTNLNTFTVYAIGHDCNPSWIEADESRRRQRWEYSRQCIEIAPKVGSPNVTLAPGGRLAVDKPPSREWAMDTYRAAVRVLAPLARERGVRLLVEPEPGCLIERYTDFLDFIAGIPEAERDVFGMNCDLGHLVCAGDDPATVIRECAGWIGHIHIEDIKDRVHDHLICGHGDIAFEPIFAALREVRYRGFVTLELYPYHDRPIAAGRESLQYLLAHGGQPPNE